jgi:hypothetical protein
MYFVAQTFTTEVVETVGNFRWLSGIDNRVPKRWIVIRENGVNAYIVKWPQIWY